MPTGAEPPDLKRRADELSQRAAALNDAYNRVTWYRFTAVFFPIPFVVVLMRLNLDYWHYYIAGGGYLLFGMALYVIDDRASDRVKRAEKEAAEAQSAAADGVR